MLEASEKLTWEEKTTLHENTFLLSQKYRTEEWAETVHGVKITWGVQRPSFQSLVEAEWNLTIEKLRGT